MGGVIFLLQIKFVQAEVGDRNDRMQTDIAIVGAGAAGSLAATMLGKAGYATVLIDPTDRFGADFRCEKIEHSHAETLQRAGVLDEVVKAGRRYNEIWITRQGRLVEKRKLVEYGIDYAKLVNTLRDLVPKTVHVVRDKVTGISTGESPSLTLAGGGTISARLVVVATGLGKDLFSALGVTRKVLSRCHSVSLGFDIAPVGRDAFDFEALTYFGEHPRHRVAYFTLFPMQARTRANLFVYREPGDPWFKTFRESPAEALRQCMPRLLDITGNFALLGPPKVRPFDLMTTENPCRPGVVFVGDAFATACPASGTGASKAFLDAERLCNVYVPTWLARGTIGADAIAAFYADPIKVASDRKSRAASTFAKRLTLEPGIGWSSYRWARFAGAATRNAVSRTRQAFAFPPTAPAHGRS